MGKIVGRQILLAACVVFCSSISWGQQKLIANIPFEFRSPAGHLPAGHYEVVAGNDPTRAVTIFRNLDSKRSVLMLSGGRTDSSKAGSDAAKLTFECRDSDCSLAEIWPGYRSSGWWFIQPQKPIERKLEMATVDVPLIASNRR
jgi:hypothetical protein